VFPVDPPFRLRVSHHGHHTSSVGRYQASLGHTHVFSTVSSAHTWVRRGEPNCLRLHRAGSTIPRLGPTGSSGGWLPSITTRWFSASPSDPPSREAPCPPKYNPRWLQVPLGCFPLSRSCPFRGLHTCLALRPVRHYPHFWISTWGLRLSGTSTHLTHVLPGTHYEVLRHLQSIPTTSGLPWYPVPALGDWFCSTSRITIIHWWPWSMVIGGPAR